MKLKKILSVLAVAAFITSCANNTPEVERYNAPRYVDSGVIELKVNKVDVISEFLPKFERPHVEQLFPISIEKTARLWAKDRLDAVDYSSNKIASFIIKDASVTEEVVESGQLFYKDNLVYKANLNVVLKISDELGTNSAQTEIVAWRELEIPADTDIIEKEKYWNNMVQKLFFYFFGKILAFCFNPAAAVKNRICRCHRCRTGIFKTLPWLQLGNFSLKPASVIRNRITSVIGNFPVFSEQTDLSGGIVFNTQIIAPKKTFLTPVLLLINQHRASRNKNIVSLAE